MEWKRAGRPSKVNKNTITTSTATSDEEKWTKLERSMFVNGTVAIAAAVIRQWIVDGRPSSDYIGVLPWITLLKNYFAQQDNKSMLQNISMLIGGN